MWGRACSLTLVLAVFTMLGAFRGGISTPDFVEFSSFPLVIGDWKLISSASMTPDELRLLQLSDYMLRRYQRTDGRMVDLYVGYHGGGEGTGPVHSPRHCLPGSGWHEESSSVREFPLKSGGVQAVRAVYGKDGRDVVFYYWFDVLGQSYTDEFALKLAEMKGALLHGRRDALLVRIAVPSGGNPDEDDAVVADFMREAYPVLRRFIPL